MADERSLSELFWDYGVYAPIGLAVSIAEEIPRLSDKGKGAPRARSAWLESSGRWLSSRASGS